MNNLIQIMTIAIETKPKFGAPCNQCGYCCLTEVCNVGQALGGGTIAPCKLLVEKDGKHLCSVADIVGDDIGIGVGCCAETQNEAIARVMEAS